MQQAPNQRRNLFIALLVIVLLIAGAVALYMLTRPAEQTPSQQTETTPESETSTETPDEPVVISFTASGFMPRTLTVKKGAVVSVINDSSTNVQFSSNEHPTHKENDGMNLQLLAPGESSNFKAERVGTWGFHDHIDDSKTGTLIVTE